MSSPGAAAEAFTIGYWFHITDPLSNWSVYEVLAEGLIQAKADYQAARAVHDHELAARRLVEVNDLTELCAAGADALALQRVRCFAQGKPWPLARLPAI